MARKPLIGTVSQNALEWGTGGLNIDGSRIEGVPDVPGSTPSTPNGNGITHGVSVRVPYARPSGRWPANLILVHDSRCVPVGTRKVAGSRTDTRPEGDGGREDVSQWRFRPTDATRRGYSDEDGTETVDAWACADGCPVKRFGESSGTRPAGYRPNRQAGWSRTQTTAGWSVYGHCRGYLGDTFDDAGTATRFFVQVQDDSEP